MTHTDVTAIQLLNSLPPADAAAIRTLAVQRRVSVATIIREGLLKIAAEIVANQDSSTQTADATSILAAG